MSFIDDLLVGGHPAVIHFPIIGIIMGMVAGMTALFLGIFIDIFDTKEFLTFKREDMIRRYIDRFEFTSLIMIIMGELGLLIAAYTGFQSSDGFDNAITSELLAYKVRISIYIFFILLAPIVLKLYIGIVKGRTIFEENGRIIPFLYIFPQLIAAILTVLVSGAGGRYVYGHSVLDNFGLGWLLPA